VDRCDYQAFQTVRFVRCGVGKNLQKTQHSTPSQGVLGQKGGRVQDETIGARLVALEAGHIKWHQAGGPDTESNGLALCSMHHKLFDLGVFTITDSMEVIVSEEAHGTKGFQEWVLAFHGKKIQSPLRDYYLPEAAFVNWHVREVFHKPGRVCGY